MCANECSLSPSSFCMHVASGMIVVCQYQREEGGKDGCREDNVEKNREAERKEGAGFGAANEQPHYEACDCCHGKRLADRERERETLPARAQCCLVCCSIQKQQRRFRCEVTRQLHLNTRKGLRHKNTRSRDRETEACPLSRTNNRHLLSQNIVSSVKSPPCPHPPPLRDGTGNTETSRHRRVLEVDFEQRE